MWETLFITALFVALAFVLLAVKIIFVKNGRFPQTHIAGNKALRRQGIGCAKSMDHELRQRKGLYDLIAENEK